MVKSLFRYTSHGTCKSNRGILDFIMYDFIMYDARTFLQDVSH